MAYLDAIGKISGVNVLNHCQHYKAGSMEQLTNGKEGRQNYTQTSHICIYEELPHTKNIFTEVNSIITYFCFLFSFFKPICKEK